MIKQAQIMRTPSGEFVGVVTTKDKAYERINSEISEKYPNPLMAMDWIITNIASEDEFRNVDITWIVSDSQPE